MAVPKALPERDPRDEQSRSRFRGSVVVVGRRLLYVGPMLSAYVIVDSATLVSAGERGMVVGPATQFIGATGWTGHRLSALQFTRQPDADFYLKDARRRHANLFVDRKVAIVQHTIEGEREDGQPDRKVVRDYDPYRGYGWAAIFAIFLIAIASYAYAVPPENADPALAPWFQSLKAPSGYPCCSQSDCRSVETKTDEAGNWWVNITAQAFERFAHYDPPPKWGWKQVPPDKILQKTENPVGRGVACWTPGNGILCFVRPVDT